ncbi:DUF1461 domain-containing protein [Candidatus Woesearchaeota archaeon]|nr:DUF1461 domain-containing protein [Candidatus Woesearchaeota archaeon]
MKTKLTKLFSTAIFIFMVLNVPVLAYLYSFNAVAFDSDFYKKEFLKHDVYLTLQSYNIDIINKNVLSYLAGSAAAIENDFFNEREKTHFADVKALIEKVLALYYYSAIIFLLLLSLQFCLSGFDVKKAAKKVFSALALGSILTLLTAFLLFAVANFNFDAAFDIFHNSFFAAGTYTFAPEFEKIVLLYPEKLFLDIFAKIIINAIISSIIIFALSASLLLIFFGSKFKVFFWKNFDGKSNK